MNLKFAAALLALAGLALAGEPVFAQAILAPGDSILAIDLDPPASLSNYPAGEPPAAAVDGALAKYLNFAGPGSGLIVTPAIPVASIADGIRLTTANDAEGRDPTSFQVWGTNDPITSVDNSTGLAENWTLIAANTVSLPAARDTVGDLITFPNASAYKSYKVIFPTLKADPLFQIAEVELFGDVPSFGVFDINLFGEGDPATLAVHFGPNSRFPGGEAPSNVIDGNFGTKYLNFGEVNSGFIVTPSMGPDAVRAFRIATANDAPERDPSSWELYGTNDPITSQQNSQGDGENWVLVDSGVVDLPVERGVLGTPVIVDNDTVYSSYRMVFTGVRDAATANSMQIAEIRFFNVAIPEPSSLLLTGLLLIGSMATVRARR